LAHKHFAITCLTPGAEDDDDLEIIIPGRFQAQFSINSKIMTSLSSNALSQLFLHPPDPDPPLQEKKTPLIYPSSSLSPSSSSSSSSSFCPSRNQSINTTINQPNKQSINGAKQSINNLQIYISNKQTNNMTNVVEPSTSNVLEV
jgi:hypothetical protein